MEMCGKEKEKFHELKEDFGVINFYQRLVQQNSEKIVKKLL